MHVFSGGVSGSCKGYGAESSLHRTPTMGAHVISTDTTTHEESVTHCTSVCTVPVHLHVQCTCLEKLKFSFSLCTWQMYSQHPLSYVRSHTDAHTHSPTHITRTHTCTCTHTHAHTYTHTPSPHHGVQASCFCCCRLYTSTPENKPTIATAHSLYTSSSTTSRTQY